MEQSGLAQRSFFEKDLDVNQSEEKNKHPLCAICYSLTPSIQNVQGKVAKSSLGHKKIRFLLQPPQVSSQGKRSKAQRYLNLAGASTFTVSRPRLHPPQKIP